MSTLHVELENLKSGVRYSFTTMKKPNIIVEGTFDGVIEPSEHYEYAQYKFSNVVEYIPDPQPGNPNNKRISKSMSTRFTSPNVYPRNISVFTSDKLPGELNQMINEYARGKSRKSRKSYKKSKKSYKKSKKSRKSRRHRR